MKKNLRGIDLNLLTVFDAIVAEGKLSKAGERLGMTQPAVSGALARLRITFDDELFIRTGQGMEPTPKAHTLIEPIRDALSIIQATLEHSKTFDPYTSQRVFKLSMSDVVELSLMPLLLKKVSEQSPSISFESFPELSKSSFELLKQGQLDIYFDYIEPKDKQLEYYKVAEDFAVVIARENHPRIDKKISMKQYLAERHIILNHRHNRKTVLEQLLEGKKLPRKVLAEVRQYTAVPEMVTQTDAIAVLPKRLAYYYANLLPIKIMPFPLLLNKLPAFMIWHKALNQDQGHLWLRKLILELSSSIS